MQVLIIPVQWSSSSSRRYNNTLFQSDTYRPLTQEYFQCIKPVMYRWDVVFTWNTRDLFKNSVLISRYVVWIPPSRNRQSASVSIKHLQITHDDDNADLDPLNYNYCVEERIGDGEEEEGVIIYQQHVT